MKKYFTKENITTIMGIIAIIIGQVGVINIPDGLLVVYNVVAVLLITLGYDKEQVKQIFKKKE